MTYDHPFRSYLHDRHDQREPWEPAYDDGRPARLTRLTFLDGRLVEARGESVWGSEWEELAARQDREEAARQRALVEAARPPEPLTPTWEQALRWLSDRVGGEAALTDLDTEPLGEEPDLPDDLPAPLLRERAVAVAELLDAVADRLSARMVGFPGDPELRHALRAALVLLCREEPHLLAGSRSAAAVAGGIAWAVLKANGVLRPAGELRVGWLQDALALPSSPSSVGGLVRGALIAFRARTHEQRRPAGVPDLLDLGRPELLTSRTRALLVHVRDRALEARAASDSTAAEHRAS